LPSSWAGFYMVIARSVCDVAISEIDSFASLGMTHGKLFVDSPLVEADIR
jgi:hypothetical protein